MQFIKSEGTADLVAALTNSLNKALGEDKKVLWLLPAGSNVKVAVSVMDSLDETKLNNLNIMLADERYGIPGHADSNYLQLIEEGFNKKTAQFDDLLTGITLEETVKSYATQAETNFKNADVIVAFLGLGPDSHIAGILPGSPAATTDPVWAVGYSAAPYERMTLTPFALSHVNEAFVGAFGDSKKLALEKLCRTAAGIAEQPSRILCHLPEVKIYNDQIT